MSKTRARAFSLLVSVAIAVSFFTEVDAQPNPSRTALPVRTARDPLLPSTASNARGWLAFEGANAEAAGSGAKWTADGKVLADATVRVCEAALPARNVDTRTVRVDGAPLVPLVGDYWHMTHRSRASFGHQGSCWFRTAPGAKDTRSIAFPLQAFVTVRARGEGRIEVRAEDDALLGSASVKVGVTPVSAGPAVPTMNPVVISTPNGAGKRGRVVAIPTGSSGIELDDLRVYTATPPTSAFGRDVGVGSRAWGFADLHVHLATHQAMGGLDGVRTMWGVPGGSFKDYAQNPKLINRDIPRCNGYNHRINVNAGTPEGYMGAGLIGGMSGRVPDEATVAAIHGLFHHDQGGPGFRRAAHYKDGFHQQHHITAIRRAYEGGLRLMGVLANHSEFLELLAGRIRVENGREYVQLTDELDLARAHVCYVQQLADLNRDWMEVAYSADDAQRIISSNKLALVIGLELPDAGNLLRNTTPEKEVEELYAIGVRQITLIHGADNQLGGTQIFQDVYDWFNDEMWTGRDAKNRVTRGVTDARQPNARFLETREGGCNAADSPLRGQRGECVLYNLGHLPIRPVVTKLNALLGDAVGPLVMSSIFPDLQLFSAKPTHAAAGVGMTVGGALMPLLPFVLPVLSATPVFRQTTGLVTPQQDLIAMMAAASARKERAIREGRGELNRKGLTTRGELYVKAMMARGMMIDLAHASDLSTQRVFELSRSASPSADPKCAVSLVDKVAEVKRIAREKTAQNESCFANAYPLVVSHTQIRAQSIHTLVEEDADKVKAFIARRGVVGTTNKGWAPREFEISDSQLLWFERIGGVVGIFMGQDGIIDPPGQQTRIAVPNDCANSTNAFAWAYAYAHQMMNGHGAALSSDATYHDMSGPRFGPNACMGDLHPIGSIERRLNPQFFQVDRQANAVRYTGGSSAAARARQSQPPLTQFRQDTISWDYNTDGWANYGVVPDMLQDAKNLGLDEAAMGTMFRSAQDYVDAWAKATRVSRCDEANGKCVDAEVKKQDCGALCKGTCPKDANAGAPPEAPNTTPACGGEGQRACCVGETGFPCKAGLIEVSGCPQSGDCQCGGGSSFKASSHCKRPSPCGGLGERACCIDEQPFGACKPNLVAIDGCTMGEEKCKCGRGSLLSSAHRCAPAAAPCGGVGERACCLGETGFACKAGAREVNGCPYGADKCRCGKGSSALASSRCEAPAPPPPPPPPDTPCGDRGQRACCLGETGFACKSGAREVAGCPYGAALCRCGKGSSIQASSRCEAPPPPPPPPPTDTPCGDRGQRACCFGETGYACKNGAKEVAGCPYGAALCKCGKGSSVQASSRCQ